MLAGRKSTDGGGRVVSEKLLRVAYKTRKVKDLWHGLLHNYAHDLGLMQQQASYTRFIILGRSRVGSNLLRSFLNSHSQIVVFGEIFRRMGNIGWDFSYYPRSKSMLKLMQEDPVSFLETKVYGRFPRHIGAVGFKIFYYHAHDAAAEPVWSYLREHKEVKVVHLRRRNILRTYISREKAMSSNVWKETGSTSKNGSGGPMHLNYADCLREFTTTRHWEEEYDAFFADHAKLNLDYETLAEQPNKELKRIQEFLGVEHEPLRAETRKQAGRRLVDTVENYHELKAQFAGTPWSEFFED